MRRISIRTRQLCGARRPTLQCNGPGAGVARPAALALIVAITFGILLVPRLIYRHYRARLTPLASDWVRAKKVVLGYSDGETKEPAIPPGEFSGRAQHAGFAAD